MSLLRAFAAALVPASLRLFPAPCALFIARTMKGSTGVVGLEVDADARDNLLQRLNDVLEAVKVIPESVAYRKGVEDTCNRYLGILQQHSDSDIDAERELGMPLEAAIVDCYRELELIPKMEEWKPWDVPEGHTVPIVEEEDVEAAQKAAAEAAAAAAAAAGK